MQATIYCPIRKITVKALPEEIIRQNLIRQMVDTLGYSPGTLAIEKGLRQMPHLTLLDHKAPLRRADLLCFSPGIHPEYELYPLLLIECKAVKLTPKVIKQVSGYNHYVKAYFFAVVNGQEIRTGWYDAKRADYVFVNRLPAYTELRKAVMTSSNR